MLVRPHDYFAQAFNLQYAIGAFNTSNLELTQAIIAAAVAKDSPVIIQTSEGAISYAGLPTLVAMIKAIAAPAPVPVILHLDHGKDVGVIKQCIDAGYTSVMIDASAKPLAENISVTKEIVAYAHDRGVWVEAELGAILGTEGALDLHGQRTPETILTRPQDVKQFYESTGIDALAVSVGTIHGAFTGQEYIRFELLAEIEQTVPNLPLVVHGASGIADDHLHQVANSNVCKINVDTELRIAFDRAVRAYYQQAHDKIDIRELLGPARDAVQAVVAAKMDIFGSAGKATVK